MTANPRSDSRSVTFAYGEVLAPGMLCFAAGVTAAMVTLFALLGPLDTANTLSLFERVAFWGLDGMLEVPMGGAAYVLTLYLARFRTLVQVRLALGAMAVLLACPCSAVTYWVYGLFHDGNTPDVEMLDLYLFNVITIILLVALWEFVLNLRVKAKRLPLTSQQAQEPRRSAEKTDKDSANQKDEVAERNNITLQQNNLFDRLPATLGRDVIYLKVSDHYIEVTTTVGSAVTLMRFSDAVAALGDLGIRVHRSYWVAYRHVIHLVRRERRSLLHVTGGHELPVSRSFLPEVRVAVSKHAVRLGNDALMK